MRFLLVAAVLVAAGAVKPPSKLVFASKTGPVKYDHAAHVKRAKGDCAFCHEKMWPQDAKVKISSKDCRVCHAPGKMAFETKGNCERCHGKGAGEGRRS